MKAFNETTGKERTFTENCSLRVTRRDSQFDQCFFAVINGGCLFHAASRPHLYVVDGCKLMIANVDVSVTIVTGEIFTFKVSRMP